MIYLNSGNLLIRDMVYEDAKIITSEEISQGWNQTIDKYLIRLEHQKKGLCISLVAEYKGNVAGYINVYPKSTEGPFGYKRLPEIVDLGVLEKYRCKGIGSSLMEQAEKIASKYASIVFLGVGLHSEYGNAQRLYVKRGYIPDGSGVWYGDHVCTPYVEYVNDDNLIIFMSKALNT